MRNFILKHEKRILRLLEILPGFVSWNLILFPYWGILIIPNVVAYFVLFFNIYWFYQSLQIAVTVIISHLRVQASMQFDWMGDIKSFPDWKKVRHVIIIPTYKEPLHILERTFQSLADQDLPLKQLIVVLAMEKKEPEADRIPKINVLRKKFGKLFGQLIFTVHELTPGEVAGKASNERYAAIWVKKIEILL